MSPDRLVFPPDEGVETVHIDTESVPLPQPGVFQRRDPVTGELTTHWGKLAAVGLAAAGAWWWWRSR